jgi:putative spermidine/putrescine transport system substrate-binding protein
MRRRMVLRAVLVIVLVMAGVLSAFGADKINLYTNGSDNVRLVWEAVIDAFNKTNSGVTVNQQYLASGAGTRTDLLKLIAAWNSGQKEIDIDIMADIDDSQITQIKKEASLDALLKLDRTKIPNITNVLAKSAVAPDQSMAFRGTAVFLAYNSAKVATPPKTEKQLHAWIKANPGRFAYNDPSTGGAGSSFVLTTIYNLMPAEALASPDEKWMAQWAAGFAVLKDLHPYLYKASGKVQYTVKNQGSLDLLADGTIWMCPAWADMTLDQKSRGLLPASIKLAQIEPSLTGALTQVVIPSMSKNAAASYKFLNYVASVEAQDIFVKVMKAIPVIDTKKLPASTLDLLSGLQMASYRTATIGGLGTLMQKRWTQEIATLP